MTDTSTMKQPVFILGSHKSGSSLLRSLLDGHPDLLAMPTETHFFQNTGHWVDYALRRAWPRELDRQAVVEALAEPIDAKNESTYLYGDAVLTGRFDMARFRDFMARQTWENETQLFEVYQHALHDSLTGQPWPAGKRLVEKSVENAECATLLRKMFPDCKFVHIVRNPYATLVAIRRAGQRGGPKFPYLRPAGEALRNSYHNLYRNQLTLDEYMVLRFEDLVSDPAGTMQQVASFLEIADHPCLQQPTLLGEPWGGNSSSNETFSGISKAPLEKWLGHITHIEVRVVNRMLGPALRWAGYDRIEPDRSFWRRVKGERLRTYLANRMILKLL